jgi:hypothetical protein
MSCRDPERAGESLGPEPDDGVVDMACDLLVRSSRADIELILELRRP